MLQERKRIWGFRVAVLARGGGIVRDTQCSSGTRGTPSGTRVWSSGTCVWSSGTRVWSSGTRGTPSGTHVWSSGTCRPPRRTDQTSHQRFYAVLQRDGQVTRSPFRLSRSSVRRAAIHNWWRHLWMDHGANRKHSSELQTPEGVRVAPTQHVASTQHHFSLRSNQASRKRMVAASEGA